MADTNPDRKRIYDDIKAIYDSVNTFGALSQEQKDRYCTLWEEYEPLTISPNITKSRDMIYNPPRFNADGKKPKRTIKQLTRASVIKVVDIIQKNNKLNKKNC